MFSRQPILFALLLSFLFSLLTSMTANAAPSAELWDAWQDHNDTNISTVDHSAWQAWLDEYLVTQSDGATAVRYKAVDQTGRLALDAYIQTLSSTNPLELNRAEQFAYWVNLYNALTVQVVLNNPSKESITSMGSGWFSGGPWDESFIHINNTPVTLNDIEHRILRPIWQDHRIHYVVNCASIGCPNLSASALTAANTQEQLEAAEQHFVNHPKGVALNSQGKLVLSKIYQWYREDFPSEDNAFIRYLAQVMSSATEPTLSADNLRSTFEDVRYAYDWNLNSAP
jgi:hypothetical protein